jgi:tetratricopeptide (TPR) repeat protein
VKIIFVFLCILVSTGSGVFFPLFAQESSSALYRNGIEYACEGKFQEAEEQFRKSLSLDKTDSTSLSSLNLLKDFKNGEINQEYAVSFFRGLGHMYKGEPQEAIEELTKATTLNPQYPRAYNMLGIIHAALGKPDDAIIY